MNIRIGHLSTLYHTSTVFLADERILKDAGFQTAWRLFGSGPAIVEAFLHNELDIAYIGLPPAVIGMSRGLDAVCVAGGHVEGTVIAGGSGLKSYPEEENLSEILSQLGTIGVPGSGSIHDLIIQDAVQKHSPQTRVINLPWSDMALIEFSIGRLDAVIGTPALAAAVVEYTGGKVLYPPNLLWPDNPSYGLVVSMEFLSKNRLAVKKFIALHEQACSMLMRPVGENSELYGQIASLLGGVELSFVRRAVSISQRYCASLSQGFVRSTMELSERLKVLGYIDCPVKEDRIFDYSLIQEVHPQGPHY